jgi:hypothetical protein
MTKSFSELWEESEQLQKDSIVNSTPTSIIDELCAKLSIYKVLDSNMKLDEQEKKKLKFHTFGKILVSLTQLSLIDDINTFTALKREVESEP